MNNPYPNTLALHNPTKKKKKNHCLKIQTEKKKPPKL